MTSLMEPNPNPNPNPASAPGVRGVGGQGPIRTRSSKKRVLYSEFSFTLKSQKQYTKDSGIIQIQE